MDLQHMADWLVEAGKSSIESGNRYHPTLVVETGGEMDVRILIGDLHPFEMLLLMIPELRLRQPDVVSLTIDTYTISGSDVAEMEAIRARHGGSLAAAFEAGEPNVSEMLMIVIATRHGHRGLNVPYRRTATGIEWDEVGDPDESVGRMVEVLKAVWR